jgi:rod shape-determining protein MreC
MAAANSNSQFGTSFSPALGFRFLLLAVLSILLLVIDNRENHLDAIRKAIGAAVYPLRIVVDAPVSAWRWAGETTASRTQLQLDNSRLNTERLLTRAKLQRYAALEAENARLRAMLEATSRVREQVRVAEIMSVSSDPFRHVLVIDKGTRDNVYDGQAVIDAEGIIGQIIEAGVLSSQVMLISDPGHDLPVEVNRNGLRTIARGTGEYDRLDLPFLPNNADIEPGDLLVTSGRGGAFPAGYPVAIVKAVTRIPQEPFAAVTATPAAALNQVREVMLIWPSDNNKGNSETAEDGDAETPIGVDERTETETQAGGETGTEPEAESGDAPSTGETDE